MWAMGMILYFLTTGLHPWHTSIMSNANTPFRNEISTVDEQTGNFPKNCKVMTFKFEFVIKELKKRVSYVI